MLLRLTYLGVTNALALLRLMPMSDRDKDTEILVLRHQIALLQRQLGAQRPRFGPSDRTLLAALLHRLPMEALKGLRLLVPPRHRPTLAPRPHHPPPRGRVQTQASRPAAHAAVHPRPGAPPGQGKPQLGATDVCTANCSCWV